MKAGELFRAEGPLGDTYAIRATDNGRSFLVSLGHPDERRDYKGGPYCVEWNFSEGSLAIVFQNWRLEPLLDAPVRYGSDAYNNYGANREAGLLTKSGIILPILVLTGRGWGHRPDWINPTTGQFWEFNAPGAFNIVGPVRWRLWLPQLREDTGDLVLRPASLV